MEIFQCNQIVRCHENPSLRPLNAAMKVRHLTLLAACTLVGGTANAADAVLDFRTLIPGVLDVPVYRADGTNKPSAATGCIAMFFVGVTPHALYPAGVAMPFGRGERAGYVWSEEPIPVVVPRAQAGDRVWILMRAVEPYQGFHIPEDFPPCRFQAQSEVFSLVVSNSPTPLVGLKSFKFNAAPLKITRQGDQIVLRWSAGDGTVYYDVETTSTLGVPNTWHTSRQSHVLERRTLWLGLGEMWEADWVLTNTVADPMTFYRTRLRNP